MYTHPISRQRVPAGQTFATKNEASRWLSEAETDLDRGQALDPTGRSRPFSSYAQAWLDSRGDLRPKTLNLYGYLLRQYLEPELGDVPIGKIDAATVRRWYGKTGQGTQSSVTTAKAYRLLRQIMAAAVDDMLLRANPCNLKGAAVERSTERQIPTVDDVMRLAAVVKPEYRLMILFAGVVGLRRGECFALRRRDVAPGDSQWTIAIESSIVFVNGDAVHQPPKTSAGVRRLALPSVVTAVVEEHLAEFGPTDPDGLLFVDRRTGTTPTLTVWRRVWDNARRDADVDCTFHDLRHVAGTLAATAGASVRESMARMGHSSPRAALRYQHLVETRDAEVASSIDRLMSDRP